MDPEYTSGVNSLISFRANQWTGFYMITASAMKELMIMTKLKSFTEMQLVLYLHFITMANSTRNNLKEKF